MTEMTLATQATQRLDPQSHFTIVHEAGKNSSHVVWSIGSAFLKLVIPRSPTVIREHDTLNAIRSMTPSEFNTPDVLFHGEWDGQYYLGLSKVPGSTLTEAWPEIGLDLNYKCVQRVTELCSVLAEYTERNISGFNGTHLPAFFPTKDDTDTEFAPSTLESNCREIGMDCSVFHFAHCDLGPGNVLYDPDTGNVGIIDWECAGFVPRKWIRTKFCLLCCPKLFSDLGTDLLHHRPHPPRTLLPLPG